MAYTVSTFISVVHKHTPIHTFIGLTRINKGNATSLFYTTPDQAKLEKAIEQFSPVANTYIRITPLTAKPKHGRGLENDSAGSSVLWLDYDCYEDKLIGFANLQAMPQPPTMIVDSGGGLQAYWQLDKFETDLPAIKARNKALAEQLNQQTQAQFADSCFDLARVLRVPYTLNHKYDPPKPATIVFYNPQLTYCLTDFQPSTDTDKLIPIEYWDQAELTSDVLDAIEAADKKLFARMTKGKDAPIKADGQIDRSRNDAYCALRLLGLGFKPDVLLAVLMAPNLITGLKYNATKRYDYVVTTANAAYRQFISTPDQYFIKGKFQPTSITAELQGKAHQFIYTAGELWRYRNGYYDRNAEYYIKEQIAYKLGDRWSTHIENEVIEYLKATNYKPIEACNVDSDKLINCANGMLDLNTADLQPHDPRYLSLYQLPSIFDPKVDTTTVDQFVSQILPADAIPFFWEYLGSILNVKHYWPKAFLLLIGLGDTGKSTMLRFIRAILGDYNCSSVTLQSLADNRFAIVKLYARLANIFADLDELEAGNVGQIKAITGDDVLHGEEKFQKGFDFKPTARLIFSANHYPTIKNADEAYFNRAKLIRCGNVFKGNRQIANIDAILHKPENLSAGLLRMYQGLMRLRQQGDFTPAQSMQIEHSSYWLYADSVVGYLDQCHFDASYQTPREVLYQSYREACKHNGKIPVNAQSFYRRITELSQKYNIDSARPVIDGDRVWVYTGIKPPTDYQTLILKLPAKKEVNQ